MSYSDVYAAAKADPNAFWMDAAEAIDWVEKPTKALFDENALAMEDIDSTEENRWLLIGMSDKARLLTVIYTLRAESIRIISARKATRKEVNNYA